MIEIENKNRVFEGENYFVRIINENDVYGNWWKWFNNSKVTDLMDKGHAKNTIEEQLKFYHKMKNSNNDIVFAICDKKTKKHIGVSALHSVDFDNGSAQFGIVIGETDFWGMGIGKNVWKNVVSFGFNELGLKLIHTMIFAENTASHIIAENIGFKVVKVLKNHIKKSANLYDYVVLHLSKEDWERILRDKS